MTEAPHLRIVDDETAQAVLALKKANGGENKKPMVRKPKHLLSGLLKCGCCGASMVAKGYEGRGLRRRNRVVCRAAIEARSCDNRRPFYQDAIERTVTEGLRERLTDQQAIELYIRVYNEERQKLAADAINRRARLESRIASLEKQIDRTIDMLIQETISDEKGKPRLKELQSEQDNLKAQLEQVDKPPEVIGLHPTAIADYLQKVETIDLAIRSGEEIGSEASKNAFRDLVETVTVYPPDENKQIVVEVKGRLAGLLEATESPIFPNMKIQGRPMVAGEGLEPPTRGL